MANPTETTPNKLLRDYMPGESTDTPPISSMIAEGRVYDHSPDLFNPQSDSTGGGGDNGNQNEPHDVMPDEVPFYASLRSVGNVIKIDMQQGYVFSKKPLSIADAIDQIEVDVTAAVDVTVTVGDKFWCKVDEDSYGFATAGIVIKGVTWPADSIGPELIGGDELIGSPGFTHYRLCEVISAGAFTEVKHWLTGNITHKCPELIENTINTAYTPETGARLYKRFYAPTGKHLIRELIAGDGIKITEGTDTVQVAIDPSYGPTGWDGDITFGFAAASGGTDALLVLRFGNGILTNVYENDVEVFGDAAFYCEDTDT